MREVNCFVRFYSIKNAKRFPNKKVKVKQGLPLGLFDGDWRIYLPITTGSKNGHIFLPMIVF